MPNKPLQVNNTEPCRVIENVEHEMTYQTPTEAFKDLAPRLARRGFVCVPESYVNKAPAVPKGFDWANEHIDAKIVGEWANDPTKRNCGLSIRTGDVIAIDIDCLNSDAAHQLLNDLIKMTDLTEDELFIRVGNAPKMAVFFRTSDPDQTFTKLKTGRYVDWLDDINEVEVLARGQRVTLAGYHASAEQNYRWNRPLRDFMLDALPTISESVAHAFVEHAKSFFEDEGMELKKLVAREQKQKAQTKRSGSDNSRTSSTSSNNTRSSNTSNTANDKSARPVQGELIRSTDVRFTGDMSELDGINAIEDIQLDRQFDASIGDIQKWLNAVEHLAEDRDDWIDIGMALHWASQNYPDRLDEMDMLELYHEWSSTASSYSGHEDVERVWKSFQDTAAQNEARRKQGRPPLKEVTLGSLIFHAHQVLESDRKDAFSDLISRIETCGSDEESVFVNEIVPMAEDFVSTYRVSAVQVESLAKMLRAKYKDYGQDISVTAIRKDLLKKGSQGGSNASMQLFDEVLTRKQIMKLKGYEWTGEYVFLEQGSLYFNTKSKRTHTRDGFNAMYANYLTPHTEGHLRAIVSPSDFMASKMCIPVFSHIVVMPDREVGEVLQQGQRTYNIYETPDYQFTAPEDWSDEQRAYMDLVFEHALMTCGGCQQSADAFLDWVATAILQPEKKLWFTMLQGIEGNGKSFWSEVMQYCMDKPFGTGYVRKVSPNELSAGVKFNQWLENKLVVIFEEFMLPSQARHHAQNSLKDILNDDTSIEGKGTNSKQCPSYASILAMSNGEAPLLLTNQDRRWFFVRHTLNTEGKINAFLRTRPEFFPTLYDGVKNLQDDSMRRALMGEFRRRIANPSQTFKDAVRTQRAPITADKLALIDAEKPSLITELEKLALDGISEFITPDYVFFCEVRALTLVGALDSLQYTGDSAKERSLTELRKRLPSWLATSTIFEFDEKERVRFKTSEGVEIDSPVYYRSYEKEKVLVAIEDIKRRCKSKKETTPHHHIERSLLNTSEDF